MTVIEIAVKNKSPSDFEPLRDLLKLWERKLAFLEREQAIIASFKEQFELKIRIEECRVKICELKARIMSGNATESLQKDYNLPPEVCKNQEALYIYLETIIPRLRENWGFLDIRNSIQYRNNIFKFVAKKQSFDMTIGWTNCRGEAFFIFAELYQLTINSLREFGSQCLNYAENFSKSDTKFWKPVYDFRFPNNLCFSVAFVDQLNSTTKEEILTKNPLRYSLNALWYQVPIVYELNSEKLYFYKKSNNLIDHFTGEIAWVKLRIIIQKTLVT